MNATSKIGKNTIKIANEVLNMFVLIVILLLLVFGCYAIWDSSQVHSAASSRNYEIYKPSDNDALSFEELRNINPDVFAWLTVYGTHIDYPVVQGEDNLKYVNTNAKGRYAASGAIFLDYSNCQDFTDFNSIFYGHHMERQTMFGEIGQFIEKDYFEARRYGTLYYGGQERGLEFFAFIHADAYDAAVFRAGITYPDYQQAYLDMLTQQAINIREDVPVTVDDNIVLLSTCSSRTTNGRDILVGRIISEVHDNPFETENSDGNVQIIDGLSNIWSQYPLWMKIIVITISCLLILLLAVFIYNIKQQRSQEQSTKQ